MYNKNVRFVSGMRHKILLLYDCESVHHAVSFGQLAQ